MHCYSFEVCDINIFRVTNYNLRELWHLHLDFIDDSFLQRSTHERFGDLEERKISSTQGTTVKKKNKLLLSLVVPKVFNQSEDQPWVKIDPYLLCTN